MGIRSVAVFSDADAGSLHVAEADEAVRIGPAPAAESYLNIAAILDAARATGAQAIHPGYGFLSESTEFAEACAAAGMVFIGPTAANITGFGLKHSARDLAETHGVALAPGTGLLTDADAAVEAADEIGYPVILKATAGGGGIGMKICADAEELRDAFAGVVRLGAGNFGNGGVFLESYVETARHIEVQVFGDGQGRVVALGERDCSLQRRNQKVVEETPAPLLPPATRAAMIAAAVRLTAGAHYRSAGTVEFLYDAARDSFYFLEVNTRLQVEHGVTEQVTGVDLVEWMVRGAAGDYSFLDRFEAKPQGASIQVRLYAEDPAQDFRPSSGMLTEGAFPEGPRVDGWVRGGIAGQRLVRSDAGQADRHRALPGRSRGGDAGRARRNAAGGDRDQPRLAAQRGALGHIHQRQGFDPGPGGHPLCAALDPRDRGRAIDHGAGLARTSWLLGRRRAAIGTDGRAVVPHRQPPARQRRPRGGAGIHRRRPDAAVHCSGPGLPDRRRFRRPARWRAHRFGPASRNRRRPDAGARPGRRRRHARLSAGRGRDRCAVVPRQPQHVHARRIRRPRGARGADRRHAAPRHDGGSGKFRGKPPVPRHRARMGAAGALRPARRARFLHAGRHRDDRAELPGRCTTIPTAPACA